MKFIQSDIVVTNLGAPLSNAIVEYDEVTGAVAGIHKEYTIVSSSVEIRKGVLVPGYINAHCHLELSHLKGIIPSGTGLIEFIKGVIQLRKFPQEEIGTAILSADQEMYSAGIVAVGDISNTTHTLQTKLHSDIRYRTFVEAFDLFQQAQTNTTFHQYLEVYKKFAEFCDKRDVSMVPHAPYSVSQELFKNLGEVNSRGSIISIHNQEVAAENQLFQKGTGSFLDFYEFMSLSAESIPTTGKNSIEYALENMNPEQNTLLVHNTLSKEVDIDNAHDWSPNVYWVTCPNANLYIENKLPDYRMMLGKDAKMCIGTDSLSSNWQLSIFEEMKTIKKYQSTIDDLDLIRWATINGAEALGYEDLGKIAAGSAPGLNLIDVEVRDGMFDLREAKSSVRIV